MNSASPQRPPQRFRDMVRAHLFFAVLGFSLGLAGALAAVRYGPEFMQASPFFTTLALVLVSTIAGSMTGGLLTLTAMETADSGSRNRR